MTLRNSNTAIQGILETNPLLPIALLFSLGIATCHYFPSLLVPLSSIVAAVAFIVFRKRIYGLGVVAFALGGVTYLVSYEPEPTYDEAISISRYYKARIDKATEYDNTQSATITISGGGTTSKNITDCQPIKARLTTPTFTPVLEKGYTILFYGSLEPIKPMTDLPDEWSGEQSSLNQGIYLRTFVEPDSILDISPTPSVEGYFSRLNTQLLSQLYTTSLSTTAKEFLAATLLGNTADLTQESRENFAKSGLSHILALSGLHVGVIAMIISLALWPLRLWRRSFIPIIVILFLWGYAAMTGLSPSVTRATIMMTLYLTGQMLQRQTSAVNSLCGAALLILLFNPLALFSIGFQLSFAAVLSIVLFADRINPINRRHRIAYFFASYIAVTISAVIGTGLISAIYFHQFPLYFLLSNIIASLLLPFIIGGGIIVIIVSLLGAVPAWLTLAVSALCKWLEQTATFISNLPGSTIDNIYLSPIIIVAYAAMVILSYLWWKNRSSRPIQVMWAIAVIAFFGLMIFPNNTNHTPSLYIARTTSRTDFIIDNCSDTLFIVTTRPQEPINVTERAESRYKDYMNKRGIRAISILEDSIGNHAGVSYRDGIIQWGNCKIVIIHENQQIPKGRADYAVVCRGYRGTIEEVVESVKADSIILGYDLDPRRSKKYIPECKRLGKPFINLRERAWSHPYSSE